MRVESPRLAIRSAALVAVALALACAERKPRSLDELLAAAAAESPRPIEGRLSSSRRHVAYESTEAAIPAPLPAVLDPPEPKRRLRGASSFALDLDPADRHTAALIALYRRHPEKAVGTLERLVEAAPAADTLSDLAATYLALAAKEQPWLHLDAIEAAQRAVDLDSSSAWAAFNLALSLERLFLYHQAEKAWTRYLEIETDLAWREDAEAHLAVIRAPTVADRWKQSRDRVLTDARAGDRTAVEQWAKEFPRQVKELIEDHFEEWIAAAGDEPRETQAIATLGLLAGAVAETAGERLYVDAVEVITRAATGLTSAYEVLLNGHASYSAGRAHRRDCSVAGKFFESAKAALALSGSPLALAARYEHLVCNYRHSPATALPGLTKLSIQLESTNYLSLKARTLSMLGLCAAASGARFTAISHYERANRIFSLLGDDTALRTVGLLDEVYRLLNSPKKAWRFRRPFLEGAVKARIQPLRHLALSGLARSLTAEGSTSSAPGHVLEELVQNAELWQEPASLIEALVRRAELHRRRNDLTAANRDISRCHTLITSVSEPADRDRLTAETTLASAEIALAHEPELALKLATRARTAIARSGHLGHLPRSLLTEAHAHLSLGDLSRAETALELALDAYEIRSNSIEDEELRIRFFESAQPVIDEMIRLYAVDLHSPARALSILESARARGLRERWSGRGSEPAADLNEIQAALDPSTVVVYYTVLSDELLTWVITNTSLQLSRTRLPRGALARMVDRIRSAIKSAGEAEFQVALEPASHLLLEPVSQYLAGRNCLVVVPDRDLNGIPWTALRNPESQKYLIEDIAVRISPALLVEPDAPRKSAPLRTRRALIIGNPTFDTARHDAPHLPGASMEAQSIAAYFDHATLLLRESATRASLLNSLPGAEILHVAAHVVVDDDWPLRSEILTASEITRASDLAPLDLTLLELAYLSGCSTAPMNEQASRFGIAGLSRMFLDSGVATVVGTLWEVDDRTSVEVALRFYSSLSRENRADQAFREAIVGWIGSDDQASPTAWAGYQLFAHLPRIREKAHGI